MDHQLYIQARSYSNKQELQELSPRKSERTYINMLLFKTIIAFLLQVTALQVVTAADTAAWKSRSIYFVLTDRVARSSSDTGGSSCSNLGKYCGGTFKGLESKLDYIKNLGFDAIWITPVVASM